MNATGARGYMDSTGLDGRNYTPSGTDADTADSDVSALRLPPLLRVPLPMALVLSLAYLIVFVLAVVNNSLVVSVICRNPQMRNVTNFFLANLAVADITVSFLVLPITLLSNLFTGKFCSALKVPPFKCFVRVFVCM